MKFKVGEKIKIVKPFLRMGRNHLGSVGIVTEHRCYGGRYVGNDPTHYVVKFDCYKVPHIFMRFDLEDSCELIKSENMAEKTSAPKSKIEYVRKDAFIEKARKWFERQTEWRDIGGIRHCDMEIFEDFKNYMKGE